MKVSSGGKTTSLLQGIFSIQGSNLGLLDCRQILYLLSQVKSRAVQISSLPRNSDNIQNRDESNSVIICTLLWVPEGNLSGLCPWVFCPLASEELWPKGVGALQEDQRVREEGDSDVYSFTSLPAKSPRASVSLYWRPPCWAGGPHHFLSETLSLPFPTCLFRS